MRWLKTLSTPLTHSSLKSAIITLVFCESRGFFLLCPSRSPNIEGSERQRSGKVRYRWEQQNPFSCLETRFKSTSPSAVRVSLSIAGRIDLIHVTQTSPAIRPILTQPLCPFAPVRTTNVSPHPQPQCRDRDGPPIAPPRLGPPCRSQARAA